MQYQDLTRTMAALKFVLKTHKSEIYRNVSTFATLCTMFPLRYLLNSGKRTHMLKVILCSSISKSESACVCAKL